MTEPVGTVVQGGRPKAFRRLPAADREAAFRAGVAAYEAGDFFAAHEHLEPAWMGTDDPAERDLHQGLIKLAAAYVNAVRGNPVGTVKNLRGARDRLASAAAAAVADRGLDLEVLLVAVDARLARLGLEPDVVRVDPPPLPWRTG